MHMRRAAVLLLLVFCVLPTCAPGQAVPAGVEFQVNTYTYDFQIYPAVSSDERGNFVVVWSSYGQDYYYGGVFAQRFSARGNRLGSEFQVNTYVFDDQYFPDVGSAPDGRFVVVWSSYYQDGDDFGVFAQMYAADGAPRGGEFQLNTYTTGAQSGVSVQHDAEGNFVVIWAEESRDGDDSGIFGRRFASDGSPRGSEFQVNLHTTSYQGEPRLAVRPAGDFVVSWTSIGQDGSGYGVFARRFASDGVPVGRELQVNSHTTADQSGAEIVAAGDGFVVTWQSAGQDRGNVGIFARRLGPGGLLGTEFQVNTVTVNAQSFPAIAADGDGNFTIAWASEGQDGDRSGVFAAHFASTGARVGTEFLVNTQTIDSQTYPAVTASAAGGFVITWSSFGQDGEFFGNFGRRYSAGSEPQPCPGDCSTDEVVTVDELIRGVNIALGSLPLDVCAEFDRDGNGAVQIDELIRAVNAALDGCP